MQILSEFSLILQFNLYQFLGNFSIELPLMSLLLTFITLSACSFSLALRIYLPAGCAVFYTSGLTAGKDLFKFR